MQIRVVKEFSFLNVLVVLLIINLIFDILCPIHVGLLLFFKIPISNMIFWENGDLYIRSVFIPTFISYFFTILAIPISAIGLLVERYLIKCGKILPKERIEFSEKQKTIFRVVIILAILAYIVSLCGWIHTMIPYSPEELEQLRYD